MNIADYLVRSAQSFPDRIALARGSTPHLSYRNFLRRISVMATHLRHRMGLVPGDRVALATTNSVEALEAMYATWHAGLCAVPMNAKLHPREFAFILQNSGARLCFATPDLVEAVAGIKDECPDLQRIVDTASRDYRFMEVGDPARIVETSSEALAWLFY